MSTKPLTPEERDAMVYALKRRDDYERPLTPERREELVTALSRDDRSPPLGGLFGLGSADARREVAEIMIACWEREHFRHTVH
jgi:hypothetical protein